jgi:hypothetical protein
LFHFSENPCAIWLKLAGNLTIALRPAVAIHYSNEKILFQSFFMLITTQPCFVASS